MVSVEYYPDASSAWSPHADAASNQNGLRAKAEQEGRSMQEVARAAIA